MLNEYRDNHYVPQWYQRRFLGIAQNKLHCLDLSAGYQVNQSGACRPRYPLSRPAPRSCFFERDLYTRTFGSTLFVDVEKQFFGGIDDRGRPAADYFSRFEHPSADGDALRSLVRYMTMQRLRTPRGLGWLSRRVPARSTNELLGFMTQLDDLYAAIWCESIWQIADASDTTTKFIVSDHPVTFYNRDCSPLSIRARGVEDPDLRWHGTHTIFPLQLDKVLIITNLSWLRNPYQSARSLRPNSEYFRNSLFDFQKIQTHRSLTEDEVRRLNYIIKKRALRFIAAGEEDWLFPERYVKESWRRFGDEYLLMPDPRSVRFTGQIIFGGGPRGRSSAWDEYGFRPSEDDFSSQERSDQEWQTFHRFKGEFARLFGPARRGRAFNVPRLDPASDSDDVHTQNLKYETDYRRFVRLN